jgi:hypothetical protein
MNRYIITTGQDGIHWVSLEPLLQDLLETRNKCDEELHRPVINKLQVVVEFISCLIDEGKLQDLRSHYKHSDEPRYRDTL